MWFGNLLALAQTAIPPESVQYRKWLRRATNGVGLDVDTFAPLVAAVGNVQPVPRAAYQVLGLDLSKYYVNWYTSLTVQTIERDKTGDHIIYGPDEFECESSTPWNLQDGWNAILCVRVKA